MTFGCYKGNSYGDDVSFPQPTILNSTEFISGGGLSPSGHHLYWGNVKVKNEIKS